ncbi:MAG: alpha/beta hydrolase family esterase [Thermoplasmatota archaeon]
MSWLERPGPGLAVAFLLLLAGSGGLVALLLDPAPSPHDPADEEGVVRVDGVLREYHLHVPSADDSPDVPMGEGNATALPLVIVLHGGGGDGRLVAEQTGFSAVADREGFAVAYPNAHVVPGSSNHFWNAGFCCDAALEGPDDVLFLRAVIDDVATRIDIDLERVYLVGFSNGGMMVHWAAASRPSLFDGIAVVSGAYAAAPTPGAQEIVPPSPSRGMPTLLVHGLKDGIIPADGGPTGRANSTLLFPPVEDALAFWARAAGYNGQPERTFAADGDHLWLNHTHRAVPVSALLLREGLHRWPVEPDATRLIWRFFETAHAASDVRRDVAGQP